MTECEESLKVLEVLFGEGDGGVEEQAVLEHAATCMSCGELRELHEYLGALEVPDPDDGDLAAVRSGVLDRLSREGAAAVPWKRPWVSIPSFGRPWGGSLAKAAALLIAAAALLAVGFASGRQAANAPLATAEHEASITMPIELAAARSRDGTGQSPSPFVYSNVRLADVDSATVRLGFDVTTRLELVRPKDDPLVADVLVQSLARREPIGTRLAAIEAAAELSPAVRGALITAMLEDESLAVRLKALSKLTAESGSERDDRALQPALLEVLKREESVQMRLLAIDHLARSRVSPEALSAALETGRPEPGTAVYARADEYLRTF